jgi:hypothetical protein
MAEKMRSTANNYNNRTSLYSADAYGNNIKKVRDYNTKDV